MTQRSDLIKKIKALLAKTVENGCTEDEAITAAEHVDKLLRQYDLTFEDVEREVRQEKYETDSRPVGQYVGQRRAFPAVQHCMRDIADYFDCETWYHGINIVFFGTVVDADLAHDMLAGWQHTIETETIAFLARTAGNGENGMSKRRSFEHGIADRMSERLRRLKKDRSEADKPRPRDPLASEPAAAGSGPGFHAPVVVAKQMVLKEKFKELGIRLTRGGGCGSRSTGSHSSYMAGQAAGSRVSLSPRRGLPKK